MSEWNIKIDRPFNRIFRHPDGYLDGCVVTEHGIVQVYSQGSKLETPSTSLSFAFNGRFYCRSINRRFTSRGLVTKASDFAAEIVEKEGK
jgi:hypothetical protein